MSPLQEIKNNPITALVVALLIAAIAIIGGMNQAALSSIEKNMADNNHNLWAKMDRITSLMLSERDLVRAEVRDLQKMSVCNDRDLAEIRERIKGHIENGVQRGNR